MVYTVRKVNCDESDTEVHEPPKAARRSVQLRGTSSPPSSNSHKVLIWPTILRNITRTQPQVGAKHVNIRNRALHIWAWAFQLGLNDVLPEYAE